jgi:lysophospholipase L1-like esterase
MAINRRALPSLAIILSCAVAASVRADGQKTDWKFNFGDAKSSDGIVTVQPGDGYTAAKGYGFEVAGKGEASGLKTEGNILTSGKPFYFSAAVPEGNYNVTVTLGGLKEASTTTVKAELRRLMLDNVPTDAGASVQRSFTVNIRVPEIAGGGKVSLKAREKTSEAADWDDKLTLEFDGDRPAISSLSITKVDVPTVYILGDSTVCDQPTEPFNSWGQMLTRFLKPGVAVSNQAESGESLRSSQGAHRFDKVLSTIKAGDYLFIQYGHNDQKEKGADALASYTSIYKKLIDAAKEKGATPVVVTSMNRESFDKEGHITNSFITQSGDYIDAARRVAKDEDVALIDLNALSKTLYEAVGPEHSQPLFANAHEHTHHSDYGSYELAKCIVLGIQQDKLGLAQFIADDWKGFDPAKPDTQESLHLTVSPGYSDVKPLGN